MNKDRPYFVPSSYNYFNPLASMQMNYVPMSANRIPMSTNHMPMHNNRINMSNMAGFNRYNQINNKYTQRVPIPIRVPIAVRFFMNVNI